MKGQTLHTRENSLTIMKIFSRSTGSIQPNLHGTKHPGLNNFKFETNRILVAGIQECSNEGPYPSCYKGDLIITNEY